MMTQDFYEIHEMAVGMNLKGRGMHRYGVLSTK